MTDELIEGVSPTASIREAILPEPKKYVLVIREAPVHEPTKAQAEYARARQKMFGPESDTPFTQDTVGNLLQTALAEVGEAIETAGPAGSMTNRGETHLGALQTKFQDALAVLSGDRKSPARLQWALQYVGNQQLDETVSQSEVFLSREVNVKLPEDEKPINRNLVVTKRGDVNLQWYPDTALGDSSRQTDLDKANINPERVSRRIQLADAWVNENYPVRI